jgi:hypothetical protein
VGTTLLNGATGNGYDDDCDGLVDEGCSCTGNGPTKDCFALPATQANPASGQPVGWCLPNAKGTVDCANGTWSGVCRGGTPPNPHDTCGTSDFNCDGLAGNNDLQGCNCAPKVVCPTTTISVAPYPSPTALPMVDGSAWIVDSSARASATNWSWTAVGGDCDGVLPFPTFALYNGTNSTTANARKGTRTALKYDSATSKYFAMPGEPLIGIQANAYGSGVAGGQVFPAFALSGDYVLQGEFDLAGTHYVCPQKIRVASPGIRAELCWDTVGGSGSSQGNDIDLHFARLQGTSCVSKGWDSVCSSNSIGLLQDCYYSTASGCPGGSASPPGWGYADSPSTACQGWGSKRSSGACTNPRLDRDNITCDRTISDPNSGSTLNDFCGPENINLDNPKDNDSFVVGVNHYANQGGSSNAHPHVNVYCNGQRVLSSGFSPLTGQLAFPLLSKGGADTTGDWWNVATITAHVAAGGLTCDVATLPSRHADPTRDGPSDGGSTVCVDSTSNLSPTPFNYNYASHKFVDPGTSQGLTAGAQPVTAAQWCKH